MDSAIRLHPEFTYRTLVAGPHEAGEGPQGRRQVFEMRDGVFEGPRLSGRTLGAAADWMLAGSDGFLRMDVRLQLLTGDGAVVLAHYRGPAEANAALMDAMTAGAPTRFADARIRTVWELESGDPRYAWVNQSLFVGEGRFLPSSAGEPGFEHRVHRVG